jgi:nicotinamidase/pyrazinamidase
MSAQKVAFVDVDTQFDFMDPDGKLYVERAERIVPNLRRLMKHAESRGIPVISTADAHTPDDPEFEEFPPHCVKGEPGQERIPATQLSGARVVPPEGTDEPVAGGHQVVVEKRALDVFTNPSMERVLKDIPAEKFFVFGVTTEYCVRAAALGLRQRGYPATVVVDAVEAIEHEAGKKALHEMEKAGVEFTTTDEVIAQT